LSSVGVEFVDDIVSYENIKIHILNGEHIILAYLAALRGHETISLFSSQKLYKVYFLLKLK